MAASLGTVAIALLFEGLREVAGRGALGGLVMLLSWVAQAALAVGWILISLVVIGCVALNGLRGPIQVMA